MKKSNIIFSILSLSFLLFLFSADLSFAGYDGACGPGARSYDYWESGFDYPLCSLGTREGSVSFPSPGGSASWTCLGGGTPPGSNAGCSASVGYECYSDSECNDGNECTNDSCTGGSCYNSTKSLGTSCDSGNGFCGNATCYPYSYYGGSCVTTPMDSCLGSNVECAGPYDQCECSLGWDKCEDDAGAGCECYTWEGDYGCFRNDVTNEIHCKETCSSCGGSCTPDNSACAENTCSGKSCWDGCNWIEGTKTCDPSSDITLTANPNPIQVCDGSGKGITTLSWEAPGFSNVEVHVGSPDGALFSSSGSTGSATTEKWVTDGMVFYLIESSSVNTNTLKTLTVNLTTDGCPTTPPPSDTATIQGRHVTTDGSALPNPIPTVYASGGSSDAGDPYFITVDAGNTYTVGIPDLAGYNEGYTLCIDSVDCHNQSPQSGTTASVTIPSGPGHYADLWWHYTPVSTPPPTNPPAVTLFAPSEVATDQNFDLVWNITNAVVSDCYTDGEWVDYELVRLSSSKAFSYSTAGSRDFTLTCNNSNGYASETVTVNVVGSSTPPGGGEDGGGASDWTEVSP